MQKHGKRLPKPERMRSRNNVVSTFRFTRPCGPEWRSADQGCPYSHCLHSFRNADRFKRPQPRRAHSAGHSTAPATDLSPSATNRPRTSSGSSSHRAINPRISLQFAPLRQPHAPDSAPPSLESGIFPAFWAVFRIPPPLLKTPENIGFSGFLRFCRDCVCHLVCHFWSVFTISRLYCATWCATFRVRCRVAVEPLKMSVRDLSVTVPLNLHGMPDPCRHDVSGVAFVQPFRFAARPQILE